MKTSSRYIHAFVKLMLLSAVLHLSILAIYFYSTHDSLPLNFFSIIGANLFFPSLITGRFSDVLSVIVTVGLYGILFLFFTHDSRRTR